VKDHKRVLVAPLDWGLGHATRSMPIINYLLEKKIDVILATNGRPYDLLKKEYPNLVINRLSSYDIRYYSNSIHLNIVLQSYKLLRAIWREHQQVAKMVEDYHIDAIISDNRFGCHYPGIPNIFISHQLNLIAGYEYLEKWANSFNHYYIKKFDECWVPDFEGEPNLSGQLSHPSPFTKTQYLGPITRIKPLYSETSYDIAFVLSGPEPQRTRFERKIMEQAMKLPHKMLLIQGKPEKHECSHKGNVEIHSYMKASELNKAIAESKLVVCRSGYSTVMDLVALGKKALLVPTPGQTEQEYLAKYYMDQKISVAQSQGALDLKRGIQDAVASKGFGTFDFSLDSLHQILDGFIEKIK